MSNDGQSSTSFSEASPWFQRSPSQWAISHTFTGTANLARHLPIGTLVAFQLLIPIFTRNGVCDFVTRTSTLVILVLLSLLCFLTCFTDTVKTTDRQVYHGFANFKGIWLFDCPKLPGSGIDSRALSRYRIDFKDWVHAVLSMLVFGAIAFRDKNVLACFYPAPTYKTREVLDIAPVGVGFICSFLFIFFPSRRHGIRYPVEDIVPVRVTYSSGL